MTHDDNNSRNVPWRWVAGILMSLVILGAATWARDVQRRVADLEKNVVTQAQFNNRFDMMQGRMIRLEDKLDLLLERSRR